MRKNRKIHKKIDKNIQTTVKKYINAVEDLGISVDNSYIFGSQAKGYADKDSDIDVCVISSGFEDYPDDLMLQARKKRWDIDLRIEPHFFSVRDFKEKSNPLVFEISKHGVAV